MADYIVPLSFHGQRPDFKTLTMIKHPLQSILRNYFKGQLIEIKFVKQRRDEFKIVNFHGAEDELKKAISIANRSRSGHSPDLARISIDTEKLYLEQEESEEEPVTDASLKEENEVLQSLYQERVDAQLGTEKHYKNEIESLERKLREADPKVSLNNAIRNITEAKKKSDEELARTRAELKMAQMGIGEWEERYRSLSKTVEELAAGISHNTIEVAYRVIEESGPILSARGAELEAILAGTAEPIIYLLNWASAPFYVLANQRLNRNFSSDEDAANAANTSAAFGETTYSRENLERYEESKLKLEAISEMRAKADLLGDVVDFDRVSKIETDLQNFRKEYEAKKSEHEGNLSISKELSELKAVYEKARALADYARGKPGIPIPVLLAYENGEGVAVMPKGSGFILSAAQDYLKGAFFADGVADEGVVKFKGISISGDERLGDLALGWHVGLAEMGFSLALQRIERSGKNGR